MTTPNEFARRAVPYQDTHLFASDAARLRVHGQVLKQIIDAVAEEREACALEADAGTKTHCGCSACSARMSIVNRIRARVSP